MASNDLAGLTDFAVALATGPGTVWAGGECAVTRRQLRRLVEVKIAAVREQVDDSATFLRQLEGVHERLDELLTTGQTATGCECAPELPHVSAGTAAAGGARLRVRETPAP